MADFKRPDERQLQEQDTLKLYRDIIGNLADEIARIERRLEDLAEHHGLEEPNSLRALRRERRLDSAFELLTVEVPSDRRHKRLRARLVQQLISKIVIHEDLAGREWLEVKGQLRPEGLPSLTSDDPVAQVADLLDAYLARKAHGGEIETPAWIAPTVPVLDEARAGDMA
jgi:hypothetical protein